MPPDCLVKVFKRHVGDTEAEILCRKGTPEQREDPRMKFWDTPGSEHAGRNLVRE